MYGFEVEPRRERRRAVAHRAPIGYGHALVTELIAKHGFKQVFVLRAVLAVELIVSAHDGGGLCFERYFKRL